MRKLKYIILIMLSALILGGLGALAWLLGTTEGARWLLATISERTALTIAAERLEGRIWGELHMKGLRIRLPDQDMAIGSADLVWRPAFLLTGRVAIRELKLSDLLVRDSSPPSTEPPSLKWPKVSGVPAWLKVRVRLLQLERLDYRRPDEEPVLLEQLSCRLTWRNRFLDVQDLSAATPDFGLRGAVLAGFRRPSLFLKLYVTPKTPAAEMDTFFIYTRFYPASSPEQVAGPVRVIGLSGEREKLRITGEVGVTGDSVNVKQLQLVQPDRRGLVSGEGTLAFREGGPFARFRIGFENVDLSPEAADLKALSGVLAVEGSLRRYEGRFTLSNKGKQWRTAALSGSFRGDGEGVKLADLDGTLLGGRISGSAEAGWKEGVSLAGNLRGRNLNPGQLSSEWSGVVNFDVEGSADWSDTAPLRAEVKGSLLESRLRGKVLTGAVDARWQENNLFINNLVLRGNGFDIAAEGELRDKIAVNLDVDDLSGLVPDTRGTLQLGGWVRWKDDRLSGSVSGKGRGIRADDLQVGLADLAAVLSDAPGYPVRLEAAMEEVVYGGISVERAELEVAGSIERHTISAELREQGIAVAASVSGVYGKGRWQGVITRFEGRDGVAPWRLQAPATLRMEDGTWALSPLVLTGVRQERLELEGQVDSQKLQGNARLQWRALDLSRLSRWLDDMKVSGTGSGTLRAGLQGKDRISLSGRMDASGSISSGGHRISLQESSLALDWTERGTDISLGLRLVEGGTFRARFTSPQPGRLALPSRGDIEASWTGFDVDLLQPWLPEGLELKGSVAGQVAGRLLPGVRFDISGNTAIAGGSVKWAKEDSRLSAAVQTAEIAWTWQGGKAAVASGEGAARFQTDRFLVRGQVESSGTVVDKGRRLTLRQISLNLDLNDRGMSALLDMRLAEGGMLNARFTSPEPGRAVIPSRGDIEASWQGVDVSLFHPWLPSGLDVEGQLAGKVSGRLQPGARVDLTGSVGFTRGKVKWVKNGSQFAAEVRTAEIDWNWRETGLTGRLTVVLADYGSVRGDFRVPLAARLPAAMDPRGAVDMNLTGKMKETGLLHRLFPGLVQESHGELDFAVKVGGTWQKPEAGGNLKLSEAGAYLPAAGVQLKDVSFEARLAGDRILIESFQARSEPGSIKGNAVITLDGWRVTGYQGSITGEKFRVVYLPELQVLANPDLTFSGTGEKLTVRGEILIPELLVQDLPAGAAVQPSADVVIEGATRPAEKEQQLAMDVEVRVVLGDKVLVKAQGIDAQLKGSVTLTFEQFDEIRSVGQIRVVKGSYKTYGVDLEITRGRVFYAGGAISQPTLDVLAIRQVGDVKAGVTVSGTPENLAVRLYSEPSMPDVDVLSYIVLGHPTAYSGEQASLMARAAGTLLTSSQAREIQDQLKNRLGLDVLEIKPATGQTTGYKPIAVTPPGVAPSGGASTTMTQTMITIGKYLTPDLYISYGRSLFSDANIFRLRYTLSKSWEIETQAGADSGADIFYKINFK